MENISVKLKSKEKKTKATKCTDLNINDDSSFISSNSSLVFWKTKFWTEEKSDSLPRESRLGYSGDDLLLHKQQIVALLLEVLFCVFLLVFSDAMQWKDLFLHES